MTALRTEIKGPVQMPIYCRNELKKTKSLKTLKCHGIDTHLKPTRVRGVSRQLTVVELKLTGPIQIDIKSVSSLMRNEMKHETQPN